MKVPSTSKVRQLDRAVSFAAVLAPYRVQGDQAERRQDQRAAPGRRGGGSPLTPTVMSRRCRRPMSPMSRMSSRVNGEDISKDEFTQIYESQFQQMAMQQQSTGEEVDQAALKQQVAEQLVDNHLLLQGASEAGIEPTDEDIDATLEEIAQQNGLGSADEVVSTLEQQGMSEEDVREDAASQHMLTAYIEQEADIEALRRS